MGNPHSCPYILINILGSWCSCRIMIHDFCITFITLIVINEISITCCNFLLGFPRPKPFSTPSAPHPEEHDDEDPPPTTHCHQTYHYHYSSWPLKQQGQNLLLAFCINAAIPASIPPRSCTIILSFF